MNDQLSSKLEEHSLTDTTWNTLKCIVRYPIKGDREVDAILYWFDFLDISSRAESIAESLHILREKDLIQTIDEKQAVEIRRALVASQPAGMTGYLPGAGNLDLTLAGAHVVMDMWRLIRHREPDEFTSGGSTKLNANVYRMTLWASKPWLCQEYVNYRVRNGNRVIRTEDGMRQLILEFKTLSIPEECGKFRDYWWRKPESGWFTTGTYIAESRVLPLDDYRPTS